MQTTPRAASLCLVVIALAAACGDPTGGEPPPRPKQPTITSSVLTSGADGVLRGTNLDVLTAEIRVDGLTVTPSARSATEIRFPMPPARACEVDGREVTVRAGSLAHAGRLVVSGVVALQVGESRVLSSEEMANLCLQLPAGNERWVFTSLNPNLEPSSTPDALFTVRSWTGATASTGVAPMRVTAPLPSARHASAPPRPAAAGHQQFSDAPEPFDSRYMTATLGDTLPWVDWWGSVYPDCSSPRDQVPTIEIVIAAVSASGKTVFAFDARSPHASVWTSEAVRQRLTRTAEMMERWAVPAVRESMAHGYEPLRGAGGRWFHVFRPDVAGWSVDNNDTPQTTCRYSSEVPSTVGPDSPPQSDEQAEYLAGLLIHEYGHHAETVYRIRRWGSIVPPSRASTGWSAAGEAWAQTVQETAARLASEQPTGARYGPLHAAGSNVPFTDFYLNGYGESPGQSLWAVTAGSRGGYYDQGTRFVMYLRERWGDAAIGAPGARFFERAQELTHYDVPSMAGLVGLSATAALDAWSLAEATDDLVDPAAAAARDLPQIASWAPDDARPLPSVMVPRTSDGARALAAGRGNYAALYFFADGADAGKGVSLTFTEFGAAPFVARITRIY